jgi:hypothetical protein
MAKQVMHPANLRLALRVEGSWWNAYAAPINTMEGAVLLGSIGMGAVTTEGGGERRKQAFIDLMKDVLDEFIKDFTGSAPEGWNDPVAAPEHERPDWPAKGHFEE